MFVNELSDKSRVCVRLDCVRFDVEELSEIRYVERGATLVLHFLI
jgi:hypothetical protein